MRLMVVLVGLITRVPVKVVILIVVIPYVRQPVRGYKIVYIRVPIGLNRCLCEICSSSRGWFLHQY